MRGKVILTVTALTVAVLLLTAVPAFAGQATHVYYGSNNMDYYVYSPTAAGKLDVSISWTGPDGTGAPVWPIAEVDGVVQTDNGTEPYADIDNAGLYAGTNPELGTINVARAAIGIPIYVGVVPFIGQVPYRITLTYTPSGGSGTLVYDSGAITPGGPYPHMAYASAGDVYVPARGSWHSVIQYWPGTMDRVGGTSNVFANWDDYTADRDTYLMWPADNWTGTEFYPPVVTDSTLGANPAPADAPAWYVVCPEIWTAAKNPNNWFDILNDGQPEPPATPNPAGGLGTPGSSAYTAAPAWYTYSFPDGTADPSKPAYFINQGPTNMNAKGRYYSVTTSISSQIKYTFTGDTLKWWFLRGPAAGIANISITNVGGGTYASTEDQYAAGAAFTSRTFSGLGAGSHVVTLQASGGKNVASTNYNFYHDAFDAPTDAGDVNTVADSSTDGSTWMRWTQASNANFSGGSQSSSAALGATCAFTFQGTSIDFIYTKGVVGGTARVYIDGVDKGPLVMYNATPVFKATQTYSGLPGTSASWHTIFITNNKNTSGTNYYIYVDAFTVGGVTYQDTP
jgi:hypothetical protein